MQLTDLLRKEYEKLYATQVSSPAYSQRLQEDIAKIMAGKPRYSTVARRMYIPWYLVGVLHLLECDCRFDCHLHNGDPLATRTIHEPKGRPTVKHWTWEGSAIDALEYDGFDKWTDWGVSGTLFRLESYNGFGYRNHGIPSPYLWSGTKFYTKGKYGADGVWNPNLVSAQVGIAAVLKEMTNKGLITFPEPTTPTTPLCEVP